MRKFEKILFFYSIATATALFITFGVFSPKPLNFISIALLIPVIFYYWIRLTSPEAVSVEKWSYRFLFSLVIVAALLVGGYYLAGIGIEERQKDIQISTLDRELSEAKTDNLKLQNSLASASAELTRLRGGVQPLSGSDSASISDLVFGTPTPIPLQQITGKKGVITIDVYASPATTAKKISTLDGSLTYLYLIKQNTWYRIALSESVMGWVSTNQVVEVQ